MKIFITGSKGQLAHDCMLVLKGRHEVKGLDLPELDIASRESVKNALRPFRPDVIVNCAAYTKVDAAETDRDAAQKANAEGPALLAQYVRGEGGMLLHISTDYVFDGMRTPPASYRENDVTAPTSWYGITKLQGEKAIALETDRFAILRTAWLYGANGQNFLKTMLKLALKNKEKPFKVVNDQFGSPTWSYRLAEQIARVAEAGGRGIYHATSEGHGTWYDLATKFLTAMQVPFAIEPCTTADYPTPARRPGNSILENRRLKMQSINVMKDWQEDVEEFAAKFREPLLLECRAVLK
ncbi:MAG: dTDP-4-dehydrorhamnose reductase [Lentisphaerota bacterium]